MNGSLSAAGRSFLRAFVGSMLVLTIGILAAPNLNSAYALGIAAAFASVAAGIRAVQAFVPVLSVAHYLPASAKAFGAYIDSFLRAFIGALVITVPGWLDAPDLSNWRTLWTAIIVGAVTAGVKAVQDLFTTGRGPVPGLGLPEPKNG
jgi:hypothetical protein